MGGGAGMGCKGAATGGGRTGMRRVPGPFPRMGCKDATAGGGGGMSGGAGMGSKGAATGGGGSTGMRSSRSARLFSFRRRAALARRFFDARRFFRCVPVDIK